MKRATHHWNRAIAVVIVLLLNLFSSLPASAYDWNDFNANQRTITFPFADKFANPGPYSSIIWSMNLACASGGCGAWDALGVIELQQADGSFVQVGRFVTPYGVATALDFDMTDLQTLFVGRSNVMVRVTVDIWEAAPNGWKMSWDSKLQLGMPNPRPIAVVPIWNSPVFSGASQAEYGGAGAGGTLPGVPSTTIKLPVGASQYKIRTLVTGHGQGSSENAAEFKVASHAIVWAGNPFTLNKTIWRSDCATSTVSGQNGSYDYSRAGFCPGGRVEPWLSDNLISYLPPAGSAVTFSYQVDYGQNVYANTCRPGNCQVDSCSTSVDNACNYNSDGHTMPFYNVSSLLIAYGSGVDKPVCSLLATPATISSGDALTLTASCAPAAKSYIWTNSGLSSSAASGSVAPTATTTYSVAGSNDRGVGNTASATVTVVLTLPVAPASLGAPSGSISNATPRYSWAASARASAYTLSVSTGGSAVITANYTADSLGCGAGSGTCSVTPSTALTNLSYVWQVRAENKLGNSAWSVAQPFTIVPNAPGEYPAGIISGNAAAQTMCPAACSAKQLKWNGNWHTTVYGQVSVCGCGNGTAPPVCSLSAAPSLLTLGAASTLTASCTPAASSYVWTNTGFGSSAGSGIVTPGSSTSYSVSGVNAAGSSNGASVTVSVTSAVPATPVGLSSTGGSTGPNKPQYSWNAASGATSYTLNVTQSSAPAGPILTSTFTAESLGCGTGKGVCKVTPATALNSGTFAWSVQAVNNLGLSAWSNKQVLQVLPAPTGLLAPSGTITSSKPTFSWPAISGASSYALRVSDPATLSAPVAVAYKAQSLGCAAGTGTCSATPATALNAGVTYIWSVQALNQGGASPWSSDTSFQVVPAAGTSSASLSKSKVGAP